MLKAGGGQHGCLGIRAARPGRGAGGRPRRAAARRPAAPRADHAPRGRQPGGPGRPADRRALGGGPARRPARGSAHPGVTPAPRPRPGRWRPGYGGGRLPPDRSAEPARRHPFRGHAGRSGRGQRPTGPAAPRRGTGAVARAGGRRVRRQAVRAGHGGPAQRTAPGRRRTPGRIAAHRRAGRGSRRHLAGTPGRTSGTGAGERTVHAGPLPGRPPHRSPGHLPVVASLPGHRTRAGPLTCPAAHRTRHLAPHGQDAGYPRGGRYPGTLAAAAGDQLRRPGRGSHGRRRAAGPGAAGHPARAGGCGQDPFGAGSGRTDRRQLPRRSSASATSPR